MKLRKFAETMISQCLEDLFDPHHMLSSIDFFISEEFHLVASMAGMETQERIRLLKLVNRIIKTRKNYLSKSIPKQAGRVKNLPSYPACSPQLPAIM